MINHILMVISRFLLLIKHFCNYWPTSIGPKKKTHNLVDNFSSSSLSVHGVSFKTEPKDTKKKKKNDF